MPRWSLTASGTGITTFEVTEGELVALLVAAQVMDQYRGTPFEQDLRKALAKISEILLDMIEVPLDALDRTTYDPEIFRVLSPRSSGTRARSSNPSPTAP